jgi:hypothetical protein
MASVKLFLGILLYLICISTLIGYAAVSMGYNAGVPDVTQIQSPSGGSIYDALGMLWTVFQTVTLLLVWNLPEEILPLWANIIFIKAPLIALIVIIADVLLP